MVKLSIIIPTFNAERYIDNLLDSIKKQSISNYELFIIDSSSNDDTVDIARKYTQNVIVIPQIEFDHGGTRTKVLNFIGGEFVIFLTQDVCLLDSSLINLVRFVEENNLAAAYGRQFPHDLASPIARHLRLFNYPSKEHTSSGKSNRNGMKDVFMSNSFSIYKTDTLKKLGGFPKHIILGEDMYLAAKLVLSGFQVGYAADACVKHSHNYTVLQEFKRYFDIGVFHRTESWIHGNFGGLGGEGKRFLISEFKYLLKNSPIWIPRACIVNFCKILGYQLGKNYKKLPEKILPKLSMHKSYWSQQNFKRFK